MRRLGPGYKKMKTFALHLTLFAVFRSLLVSAASAQNTKTQGTSLDVA